jgi:hypothetical protein
VTAVSVEKVNGTQRTPADPRYEYDPVALAEAEAIRTRAEAEAAALRVKADGEAKATEILAAEEGEKQRISNERAAMRLEREKAEHAAKVAEAERRRKEAERLARQAQAKAEAEQQAEQDHAKQIEEADEKWRNWAIRFAVVCGIVALPVQMNAFWNPDAPWMMAAPVFLEGGAWVVHRGAAAAVANRRPVWHFRSIVWIFALIAAGINLYHGIHAFDLGTALGTALASIAGPGVWDLHEHGRIRKRDGVPTRRERKATEKETERLAGEKAAEEKRRAAERAAADEAAEKARQELRETRQRVFEEVWTEAVKIGAALGKAPDDPAVWPRAYRNIKGCDPGESIESITARRTAEKRVQSALTGTPVNTVSKTANAQRANQMPRVQRGPARKPPVRRSGDTQKYVGAARRQAAITAKHAAEKKD